jgi:hypothetical protein
MAAIGTDTLTAVTRHYVMPVIADNIYASNVLLYRWYRANKMIIQGGTQIEVPVLYKRFAVGGAYRGYEVLNTSPSDTVKNLVFNWKQHYVPFAIDGLTLIQNDSPLAIASIVALQSQQAYMEMAENIAAGLFADASSGDVKDLDGLAGAVGNASVGDASYGGIARASNSWHNSQIDATTATLTLAAMQSNFGNATRGGQHYTILLSRQEQYNRYIALTTAGGYSVQQTRSPAGHDEILANAGFTNATFNNTPWVVDSHVDDGPDSSNSKIYGLNENTWNLVCSPRADFYLEDFQKPVNQDAYVSMLLWAGNAVCQNAGLNGTLSNVSA